MAEWRCWTRYVGPPEQRAGGRNLQAELRGWQRALVLRTLGGTNSLFPPAVAETWGQLWPWAACTSWKQMVCRKTPCLGFSSLTPRGWVSCTHSGKRGKWPGRSTGPRRSYFNLTPEESRVVTATV